MVMTALLVLDAFSVCHLGYSIFSPCLYPFSTHNEGKFQGFLFQLPVVFTLAYMDTTIHVNVF